jgi:hypothetical protein
MLNERDDNVKLSIEKVYLYVGVAGISITNGAYPIVFAFEEKYSCA